MLRRIIRNPSGIFEYYTSVSRIGCSRQLSTRYCTQIRSASLSEGARQKQGLGNHCVGRPAIERRNAFGITQKLSGCATQNGRFFSTVTDESKEDETTDATRDGNAPEMQQEKVDLDSEAVQDDAQIEKDLKDEQELWLKLCSNKDPNDNTVKPEIFNDNDEWNLPEDASDKYF